MQGELRDVRCHPWLTGLLSLVILTGAGLFAAIAQDSSAAAAAPQAKATGGGQYYFEFRSRYAWDYGHTYVIHGRVGEPITKDSVAGLSPVGDDATAWVIGHYVPVPAETGWTDGDIEEKYVSARYRVYVSKAEYDRVMVYIRHLQATSHVWSAELYNCNAFVADIAKFMGLKAPQSTLIYPEGVRQQSSADQHPSGNGRQSHRPECQRDEQSDTRWASDDQQWSLRVWAGDDQQWG